MAHGASVQHEDAVSPRARTERVLLLLNSALGSLAEIVASQPSWSASVTLTLSTVRAEWRAQTICRPRLLLRFGRQCCASSHRNATRVTMQERIRWNGCGTASKPVFRAETCVG